MRLPWWVALLPRWVAQIVGRPARRADIPGHDMAATEPVELPMLRRCGDGSIDWLSLPDAATGLVMERISDVTIVLQINRRDRDPVLVQIRAVGSGERAGIRAVVLRGE